MSENNVKTTGEKPKLPGGITGKGFVPGDRRINRRGRPRDLKKLRTLIQKIGFEGSDVRPDLNRLELMIRGMYVSRQSADRRELLRYGWGEPVQKHELSGKDGQPIELNHHDACTLSDDQLLDIAAGRGAGIAPAPQRPDSPD